MGTRPSDAQHHARLIGFHAGPALGQIGARSVDNQLRLV